MPPTIIKPKTRTTAATRREKIRQEYWPAEIPWYPKSGYFSAPRTLPLILSVLRSKKLSGRADPSSAYLELLARHLDGGVVEMVQEEDHAFYAGYVGTRAERTWRERMQLLVKHGFIKTEPRGNNTYGTVLLVHPGIVLEALHGKKLIDDRLWKTYQLRRLETREAAAAEIREEWKAGKP